MTRTVSQSSASQGSKSSASQISMRSWPWEKTWCGGWSRNRFRAEASSSGRLPLRRITTWSPRSFASSRKGARAYSPSATVVGKAWPEAFDSAPQQATAGAELAIAGAVGFDIERQHQAGSDHADHRQLMVITDNLLPRVMVRAAQITSLFA